MKLPLNNDKIDWTYVETLTQVIKKLVIKDLVLYTDQKISASKKVIANNKERKMSNNNFEVLNESEIRGKIIVRTSIIGIITNVLLAVFKAILGVLVNSIALTLDAVNNLSDALSSLVTIIGEKLASKAPDRKHPMGYGRIEYISSMIIAALVLYAGITSLVECVKKIINPSPAAYTKLSIFVIGLAVVVKFFLGNYIKRQGKK